MSRAPDFRVEITRGDRRGPFAYVLFISPAPRFGDRIRFAWTLRRAEAKALRWIRRAKAMGPKQDGDRVVIAEVRDQ